MVTHAVPKDISKFDTINFEFTNTLRNQNVSLNSIGSNFIIHINGLIYKNGNPSGKSATVTLVGGVSNFINEKIPNPTFPYVSVPQKVALNKILFLLGKRTRRATLSSSDSTLNSMVNYSYSNHTG